MKHCSIRVLFLILVFALISPLSAADTVIVKSPYYGSSSSVVDARTLNRSFYSQLGISSTPSEIPKSDERVLAAISNTNYPVTPGDTLSLSYSEGQRSVNLTLQVDGSYRVVIPSLGSVEGKEKTLSAFMREIESLVTTYHPFSVPRVNLIGTGLFTVTLRGEVNSTTEVAAWGLSRLSSVIRGANERASTREVEVLSSDGTTKSYDLWAALQEGDLSQNPFVKAGDIITLLPAKQIISIVGEVRREGTYQPLKGEHLSDIIEKYGRGILTSGDKNSLLIRRYNGSENQRLDIIRLSKEEFPTFSLSDMDTLYIDTIAPLSQVVTIEGAVNMGEASPLTSSLSSSGKLYYQFFPDETVSEMLKGISNRFSAVSDLQAAYLLREEKLIALNIQSILLGDDTESSSLVLKAGDRFVIPFNQLFVNVTGGVVRAGTFPYVPDKTASYYINLAGGFDPAKNRNNAYTVFDKYGNKLDNKEQIPPESVVNVKLTTFEAVHGMRLATTVTIASLVISVVTFALKIAGVFD